LYVTEVMARTFYIAHIRMKYIYTNTTKTALLTA